MPKRSGARKKESKALAAQAEKKHAAALVRMREEGEADVALIQRRREQISDAFYEIGEALQRLSRNGVAKALGYESFETLCDERLGLSLTTASRLVSIVERVKREDAVRWGQEKTAALIEIANATPTGDTPGMLKLERIKLPNGHRVDPERDSVRALKEAATELRRLHHERSRRGRTTTPSERKEAKRLENLLRRSGVAAAAVRAVATKPGQVSLLRIDVPIDRLGDLKLALGKL